MKNPFLKGNTIYLRAIEKEDLTQDYASWFNSEEVCRFNSHHRFPYRMDELLSYYESVIKSHDNLVLAIIDIKTEKHIGNISLLNIDTINRSAEFAIIIGDIGFWGKGVGKEAGKLIMDHGFFALGMNRIYCGTSADNTGMQKLADFLQFKKEGVQKEAIFKDGKFRDIFIYGVTQKKYKKVIS